MQLPLDGSFREAERLGDLAEFQTLVVTHDEHDTLAGRQPLDLLFENLAHLTGIGAVLRTWCFFWRVQHPEFGFFSKRRRTRG